MRSNYHFSYGAIKVCWLLPRFSRGSVQTILPPNKKARTGRLCSSFDDQIKDLERDALNIQAHGQEVKRKKRDAEEELKDLQDKLQTIKVCIADD